MAATRTPHSFIARLDSSTVMLEATAAYHHGADFSLLPILPRILRPALGLDGGLLNRIPERLRRRIYAWARCREAVPARRAGDVDMEEISRWIVGLYPPDRKLAGVMIGSGNGSLAHLCCALGLAWLPQTVLVAMGRGNADPDEPEEDIRLAREAARALLERNPDSVLHQMHHPNRDRLAIRHMSSFRLKKTRLGPAYERFLIERLEPGATIYIVECRLHWPTTAIQDRHYFQFGTLGGATIRELYHGSERVAEYLRCHGSQRDRWRPPAPDASRPEAEWGFEPALREDMERFALDHGYRVQRIIFDAPEDTSPVAADFYREWNRDRGIHGNRLVVESSLLMNPYLAVRTGSVPYWMASNKTPSAENLERFLDEREPFDEIRMMLHSHGVSSVGLAPITRWRGVLRRASRRGLFAGVDPAAFPSDIAVFGRYHSALMKTDAHYPVPARADLHRFESFVRSRQFRYRVRLSDALQPKIA